MRKAQAKFVRDQFLNRFTSGYSKVDKAQFPILEQILIQAGIDFNRSIVKNLTQSKAISSGDLLDVAAPQVSETSTGYLLEVGYPINSKQIEYYDFVNQGVRGVGGNKPKKNTGKYSFKNKYPNRKMAAGIYAWLNLARKSVRLDKVDTTGVQRKRRKLAKVLSEAENKKRLAYAISVGIKKNGLRATFYFDKAIKENFTQDFKDALAEALGGDIILNFRTYGNNDNK